MIHRAFNLLLTQLDAYLRSVDRNPSTDPYVVMANIATVDSSNDSGTDINNKVVLSLVNIEEEAALKNIGPYTRINHQVTYHNPPVYLNVYMLVTAYFESYFNSLDRLSDVIQFFQSKATFTLRNSPLDNADERYGELELFLDLYSMTFEQLNHLWGSLGGKQWPSALYKVRLVRINENRLNELGTVIEQVERNQKVIAG